MTVDHPVDNNYTTAATMEETEINMAVDGSTTPVSFKVAPPNSDKWQITRMIISMLDSTSMDDGKFGGIASLDNGVLVRTVKSGVVQTSTIWKNNGAIAGDMYDLNYADKAPAGQYGLRGRWTFTRLGVIIELVGVDADYVEILIQDDLTDLDSFMIEAQGRIFGN